MLAGLHPETYRTVKEHVGKVVTIEHRDNTGKVTDDSPRPDAGCTITECKETFFKYRDIATDRYYSANFADVKLSTDEQRYRYKLTVKV